MGTKMGPSYANFFEVLSNTNFLVSTTAPNLNSTVATLMIASVLPPLPPLIPFARLLNILLDIKISIEGNGLRSSIYYKHTDSHSYLLYSSSRTSHSRIPYLLYCFSDFVAYVVTTLIFPKNQWQCASFSINVAILFLSFKRATTVPNKLIDSQHYKRLRRKTLTAFHLLLHFTLTTTQLNLSFLKILNYSKTIQRLALSFRNPHLFHSNVTKT